MVAAFALATIAVIGDTLYRMAANRALRLRSTWETGAFDGILAELDALDTMPAPPQGGSTVASRSPAVDAGSGKLAA